MCGRSALRVATMIGLLRGKVVSEEPSGAVLIDVNGVGYELLTPLGTVSRAEQGANGEHVMVVHTHVREDALDLFGFASELERRVFRMLISVPNIGPKTALNVLSALPPPDLARAVDGPDLPRLNKIPGVGKKTAERMVVELKGKLPKVTSEAKAEPASPGDTTRRLMLALTSMGYRPAEAERAIQSLGDRVATEPMEILLREALGRLTT
jgi:Holliday junction DNA helicase RuvA